MALEFSKNNHWTQASPSTVKLSVERIIRHTRYSKKSIRMEIHGIYRPQVGKNIHIQ